MKFYLVFWVDLFDGRYLPSLKEYIAYGWNYRRYFIHHGIKTVCVAAQNISYHISVGRLHYPPKDGIWNKRQRIDYHRPQIFSVQFENDIWTKVSDRKNKYARKHICKNRSDKISRYTPSEKKQEQNIKAYLKSGIHKPRQGKQFAFAYTPWKMSK